MAGRLFPAFGATKREREVRPNRSPGHQAYRRVGKKKEVGLIVVEGHIG
jgi:hypothetical protein